jgi:hypothetical protein
VAEKQGQGQSHSQPERTEATAGAPYLSVVRGDATAEEIAALVATLTAAAARMQLELPGPAAAVTPAPVRRRLAPLGASLRQRSRNARRFPYPHLRFTVPP